MAEAGFIDTIRRSASKRVLFLPHAVRQMSRPDRMITTVDVRTVLFEGQVIENYPEDNRGHSALLLGRGAGGRAIHVVCSPKDDYLAVITAYLPEPDVWSADFRARVRP